MIKNIKLCTSSLSLYILEMCTIEEKNDFIRFHTYFDDAIGIERAKGRWGGGV